MEFNQAGIRQSSVQWWIFEELLKRWRGFLKYLLVGTFEVHLKICKDCKYVYLWWEQCFLLPSSLTYYLRGHFINMAQLLCGRKVFYPLSLIFPLVLISWCLQDLLCVRCQECSWAGWLASPFRLHAILFWKYLNSFYFENSSSFGSQYWDNFSR